MPDIHDNVTILFADIVGFTSWSAGKLPEEIIEMLSSLFTRFDKLCVEYKIYKVHTIGDCYVAMSYSETEERNLASETLNVYNFAKEMIESINDVN